MNTLITAAELEDVRFTTHRRFVLFGAPVYRADEVDEILDRCEATLRMFETRFDRTARQYAGHLIAAHTPPSKGTLQ
ncbi:DivIVA domain-containing protein [Bifidobacterium sp.]|uniref:DivIVA domain-containing protein n=1 Tax=Bifidobacterium sp. TaxID=41200 RepID=UPI0039ED7C2B